MYYGLVDEEVWYNYEIYVWNIWVGYVFVVVGFWFLENDRFYIFFYEFFRLCNMKNVSYGVEGEGKFVYLLDIYCKLDECSVEFGSEIGGDFSRGVFGGEGIFESVIDYFFYYICNFGNGVI